MILSFLAQQFDNARIGIKRFAIGQIFQQGVNGNLDRAEQWRSVANFFTSPHDEKRLDEENATPLAAQDPTLFDSPDDPVYEKEMDQWDRLNEAVGGDLFTDDNKLAIMRQIDKAHGATTSWEEFHDLVVAEIKKQSPDSPETGIDTPALSV